MTTSRITIEPVSIGQRGQRYRVTRAGHVVIESTREPLFDACRALLAEGITGRLEMWRAGKAHYDVALDISEGARLTVVENATRGPVFRQWQQAGQYAFAESASEAGAALRNLPLRRGQGQSRPSTARSAA